MKEYKVLLVDDEINVLQALVRHLRKDFQITTALSAMEGLQLLEEHGPFAVVLSDLRMPGMDGLKFLSKVRERYPETVRMMLTGHADLNAAIEAINSGQVFRFMVKPCSLENLRSNLSEGVELYKLRQAEKELLEKTLKGAIKAMAEILELINPEAFGRSSRIGELVRVLSQRLKIEETWELETAALLSQIGWVIIPPKVVLKLYSGESLTGEEAQIYEMHPMIGSELIGRIPRLEGVARIIAYQEKGFDGSGIPKDAIKGEEIPLGARILKVAIDFDTYKLRTNKDMRALELMKLRPERYDPMVFEALEEFVVGAQGEEVTEIEVNLEELKEGMVLAEDIRTKRGQLLLTRGNTVTATLIERLKNFSMSVGIKEPIIVYRSATP
ncbi:MAG: HD domain-containing phosphohydrolase [Desulfatiglandales bacterium]